jgi:SAM-dependent methyltransferase
MNSVFYCPACLQQLTENSKNTLRCEGCKVMYPVKNGIPVLIDESQSLFRIADMLHEPSKASVKRKGIKQIIIGALTFLQRVPPPLSSNLVAAKNFRKLGELLMQQSAAPNVLVIGGRARGKGMHELVKYPVVLTETDIAAGPNTSIICDAHRLPFPDESFDGVVIQAVLEYLQDPVMCVTEIHRVLKKDGVVYSETPFMQQVHGGKFDFMRYSHLGHRRLFRYFKEIDSGACVGTGSALAWSYKYFLLSLSDKAFIRELLLLFANWTGFFWKYFDYFSIQHRGTLDAASGYYFTGRKNTTAISDAELIQSYKGLISG